MARHDASLEPANRFDPSKTVGHLLLTHAFHEHFGRARYACHRVEITGIEQQHTFVATKDSFIEILDIDYHPVRLGALVHWQETPVRRGVTVTSLDSVVALGREEQRERSKYSGKHWEGYPARVRRKMCSDIFAFPAGLTGTNVRVGQGQHSTFSSRFQYTDWREFLYLDHPEEACRVANELLQAKADAKGSPGSLENQFAAGGQAAAV